MSPTFTDPGYTATDNIDGDITGMVRVTGTVNTLIPGTYTVSYEMTGSSGNTGRQNRTVAVSPPTDPAQYCDGMTLAQLMASGKYNIINKMFRFESIIKGTNSADLIIAGNNGPTIEGRGGDDCIIGGAGDDQMWGLGGPDTIYGDAGDDTLYGGPGIDAIYGGPGTDIIESGESDTIHDDDSSDGDG